MLDRMMLYGGKLVIEKRGAGLRGVVGTASALASVSPENANGAI